MAQIVAVGSRAFVVALAGVGAEPRVCNDPAAFAGILRELARDSEIRIVFAPEPMIARATDGVSEFRNRSHAALLGLPLEPGEDHPSLQEMRHIVEQATGASLI